MRIFNTVLITALLFSGVEVSATEITAAEARELTTKSLDQSFRNLMLEIDVNIRNSANQGREMCVISYDTNFMTDPTWRRVSENLKRRGFQCNRYSGEVKTTVSIFWWENEKKN